MSDTCEECGAPKPEGVRCGSCGALPKGLTPEPPAPRYTPTPLPVPGAQPPAPAPRPRSSRPRPVTRPGDAPRRRYPAPPTDQLITRAADTRISPQSKTGILLCHIVYPLGGARFYAGHYAIGIAQTVVSLLTCGIGALWPVIDGFVMLGTQPYDAHGRAILGGKSRKKALAAEAEAVMLQLPPPNLD